jgi:hypothetical protein
LANIAAVEKIKESASPQIFSGTATGKAPSKTQSRPPRRGGLPFKSQATCSKAKHFAQKTSNVFKKRYNVLQKCNIVRKKP